jgi:hypothetical protein
MRLLVPLLALVLSFAPASTAAQPPITIGEVTSEVVREDVDMNLVVRGVLEQELPGVDVAKPARPRPAILSLSLVRMDREAAPDNKAQVTCVVSATVRDQKKGALLAVLEGRARAENEERLVVLLERAALKSAVRGALARLPEALSVPH